MFLAFPQYSHSSFNHTCTSEVTNTLAIVKYFILPCVLASGPKTPDTCRIGKTVVVHANCTALYRQVDRSTVTEAIIKKENMYQVQLVYRTY